MSSVKCWQLNWKMKLGNQLDFDLKEHIKSSEMWDNLVA